MKWLAVYSILLYIAGVYATVNDGHSILWMGVLTLTPIAIFAVLYLVKDRSKNKQSKENWS
jgi:hypothetical protein